MELGVEDVVLLGDEGEGGGRDEAKDADDPDAGKGPEDVGLEEAVVDKAEDDKDDEEGAASEGEEAGDCGEVDVVELVDVVEGGAGGATEALLPGVGQLIELAELPLGEKGQIGRASCRERV